MLSLAEPHKTFYNLLSMTWNMGKEIRPKGAPGIGREIRNQTYGLQPRQRFLCFDAAKIELDTIKQEFYWYLTGDWHSWDADGVRQALSDLANDPEGGMAYIPCKMGDVCLISGMTFCIRNWKLYGSLHFVGQEAVRGLGYEIPGFSLFHEYLYAKLKSELPLLALGTLTVTVDSLFIGERNYTRVDKILRNPAITTDMHKACPEMTPDALPQLEQFIHNFKISKTRPFQADLEHVAPFTRWLLTRDDPATLVPEKFRDYPRSL